MFLQRCQHCGTEFKESEGGACINGYWVCEECKQNAERARAATRPPDWSVERGEDGMAEATYLHDPRYQVMEYAGGGFAVFFEGKEQQVRATFGRAMEEVECEAKPPDKE